MRNLGTDAKSRSVRRIHAFNAVRMNHPRTFTKNMYDRADACGMMSRALPTNEECKEHCFLVGYAIPQDRQLVARLQQCRDATFHKYGMDVPTDD